MYAASAAIWRNFNRTQPCISPVKMVDLKTIKKVILGIGERVAKGLVLCSKSSWLQLLHVGNFC